MRVTATVNGEERSFDVEANDLLLDVLRRRLGLTGAKRSCDVQICGACTVLVDGLPVSSCSMLAFEVDGREVTTVEGLHGDDGLHPVQAVFVRHGALQCGFCTPGMVVTSCYLLESSPSLTDEDLLEGLSGNLCRCTGYVKILGALRELRDGRGAHA